MSLCHLICLALCHRYFTQRPSHPLLFSRPNLRYFSVLRENEKILLTHVINDHTYRSAGHCLKVYFLRPLHLLFIAGDLGISPRRQICQSSRTERNAANSDFFFSSLNLILSEDTKQHIKIKILDFKDESSLRISEIFFRNDVFLQQLFIIADISLADFQLANIFIFPLPHSK